MPARRRGWLATALVVTAASALLLPTSHAVAAATGPSVLASAPTSHPTPPKPGGALGAAAVSQPALANHGGPVQTAPKVYLDFWGWTSDPAGEQPYLTKFLSSIGGTSWLATVNQYGAGSQSGLLAGSWSDPAAAPANPTDAQVQQEAANAANHFAAGNSVNVQIIVATPTGQSTAGFGTSFCAYHGSVASLPNVTYTNLPYMSDMGGSCGQNSVNAAAAGTLDGVSIVEGHELAETITDPLLNAWYDTNGQEIGDKCSWTGLADITTSTGVFAMQPLWSNASNSCTLGSTRSGSLRVWGSGSTVTTCGTKPTSTTPIAGPALSGVTSVAGGSDTGYALLTDGTVRAWGSPGFGDLGDGGPTAARCGPVQVAGLTGVTGVAAGEQNAFALKSDGTVWAWGWNGYGQLGNGTTTDSGVPVQVTGLTGVVGISSGDRAVYAVKSDGTVWAWGLNNAGQLGNGTNADSHVPVQVTGLSSITAVAGGFETGYALKSDGTVWSWGGNIGAALGTGSTYPNMVTTAIQVPGLSSVTSLAASGETGYALKSDGTVLAWGSGAHGALGNGGTANSAPIQVSGLTGVTAIAGNNDNLYTDSGYALKSDGTVWTWGYNYYGQLGNGTSTDSTVPVQVTGLTGTLAIGAGQVAGAAVVN